MMWMSSYRHHARVERTQESVAAFPSSLEPNVGTHCSLYGIRLTTN